MIDPPFDPGYIYIYKFDNIYVYIYIFILKKYMYIIHYIIGNEILPSYIPAFHHENSGSRNLSG